MRDLPRFDDPNLLIGADGFSDAGVYRVSDDLFIVQSLDFFPPLVDDPFLFGQIAAANSLSDVYAMGGRPKTALNIVGFPDDQLELTVLGDILRGGVDRVKLAGAVIAGGHTVRDSEIKYGLSVTGVVSEDRLMTNQGARAGDVLVLTKALGTGFITTAYKAHRCDQSLLKTAAESMALLNAAASEAAVAVGARGATDVTGFGLAGHAAELALASEVTAVIELSRLPLLPGASELALRGNKTRASASNREFVDPMLSFDHAPDPLLTEFLFDAQTSGGLLISVAEQNAAELIDRIQSAGAEAACIIGHIESRQATPLRVCP